MRYQPLSRRLINLIYPLVIYMAIGMAVLGIYPNGGLMANLIEKVSCIIIMGILFYKDSKALATTLVTKDRVLAHNPVGALYQTRAYYKRLLQQPLWDDEDDKKEEK